MRVGPFEVGYPHLLAIGLLLAILLTAGVGASTSSVPYGAFNPEWDGASGVRAVATDASAETAIAYSPTEYGEQDASRSVAFVISPETSYTDAGAARIESFVREGGTLVVAEDFRPHSNDLLARLGVDARVNATPLRDDRHHYRSGALPIATQTASDPLTSDVEQLTLNHPGTVDPSGGTVLVESSNFSYRDVDLNGELDENESLRSYPVVTVEPLGAGDVVVVSEPSVFINSMLERPDNRAFVEALVVPHDTVLLDYSHVGERPPIRVALHVFRDSPPLQFLFGAAMLGVLAVAARRE